MFSINRYQPSLLNQDYWPLRAISQELDRFVQAESENLRGSRVLDFGSSNLPYRVAFESTGAELVGADINPQDPRILPIDPATSRVGVVESSFDYVLSTQVLEHVPEVQQYLGEAMRVLKSAGKLFLTTHGTWYLHRVPTDMRRWTIDGLRYEHERAGFVVERIVPRIGMMATATHLRSVAVRDVLLKSRVLAPLRVATNLLFNLRMGLEEILSTPAGMEKMQQLLIVTARKP
jgi:SAM-dependent methyltransferase